MNRYLVIICISFMSCIPETVREPGCLSGSKRCSPNGQSLVCVAGDWTTDNSANPLVCR